MRLMLFFDLPRYTSAQNKEANHYVKQIRKMGFFMLQESVYCKILLNASWKDGIVSQLKKKQPKEGSIVLLTITEKQYNSMEYLLGEKTHKVFDSNERMIVL